MLTGHIDTSVRQARKLRRMQHAIEMPSIHQTRTGCYVAIIKRVVTFVVPLKHRSCSCTCNFHHYSTRWDDRLYSEIKIFFVNCIIKIVIHVTILKSLLLNASSLLYRYFLNMMHHIGLLMYCHWFRRMWWLVIATAGKLLAQHCSTAFIGCCIPDICPYVWLTTSQTCDLIPP
jgi:hypothetical protein